MTPPAERVADYPRPPRLEPVGRQICIRFAGVEIAAIDHALRVLETHHPPTYYLPPDAFLQGCLIPTAKHSFCEWKGDARYFDIVSRTGRSAPAAAWAYLNPSNQYAALAHHVAVYCAAMDCCLVDGVQATPQPGGFYGGWVTPDLIGPFKGGPGTSHW